MHHILLIFIGYSLWTLVHSVSCRYRMKVLRVSQVDSTLPENTTSLTTWLLSFPINDHHSSRVIIFSRAPNRLGGLRSSVLCGCLEGNRMLLMLAGLALVSLLELICRFSVLASLQKLTWASICARGLRVHHRVYIVDGLWIRAHLLAHRVVSKCVFFICICCRATHSITVGMMFLGICVCFNLFVYMSISGTTNEY